MNSIRRRLTLGLLALFLLIAGCGLIALDLLLERRMRRNFDNTLRTRVQSLAAIPGARRNPMRPDYPDALKNDFGKEGLRYRYLDASGRTLAESAKPPPPVPEGLVAGDIARPALSDLKLEKDRTGRAAYAVFTPADDGHQHDRAHARMYLLVVEDRHELDEAVNRTLTLILTSGGLMAAAIAALVPAFIQRALRPLEDIARRAAEIDADALDARFPENGLPQELAGIAGKLNALLARLETSFERERRFSADVSHELRTPVAELKSLAECALKWPDMRGPRAMEDMLQVVAGMERLITAMLALAACENDVTPVKPETFAPGAMLAEVLKLFSVRVAARGLELRADIAGDLPVVADVALTKAILTNLAENAVTYAPEGSHIAVALCRDDGDVVLTIANPAPDLTSEDVAKLFDGFWRKDASRTGRHAGLGLTLARTFASAMGVGLTAALDGGQIVFEIRFPEARPVPAR